MVTQKDTCYDEIGPYAHKIDTNRTLIVNTIIWGRGGEGTM